MSRSPNLVMSSKTNIRRRISSTRSGSSWARFSSRLRSVARSMTLRISATLGTPPAFSNCWLITLAMRCSRPFSTSWMISGLVCAHGGDAADDGQLPLRRQAADDRRPPAAAACGERIRAIVCGCSSMMNVSRFWLSTFCRKPKGRASIDWRTFSSVALAPLPRACSTRLLATSKPAGPARSARWGWRWRNPG